MVGGDGESVRIGQRPVDGGEQGVPAVDDNGHAVVLEVLGEPQLVVVDMLVVGRVASHHDGKPARHPGVHHRGGTTVAHHDRGVTEQGQQLAVGDQLATIMAGRRRGSGLDDGDHVGMHLAPLVDPIDEPIETMVVGADGDDDRSDRSVDRRLNGCTDRVDSGGQTLGGRHQYTGPVSRLPG